MVNRGIGHRAPLLWLLLPFMAGLAAGKADFFHPAPAWLLLSALLPAGAVVAGAWQMQPARVWAPVLGTALFLAGLAHYDLRRARLPAWEGLPPREARLTLRVERTFSQSDLKKTTGLAVVVATDSHLHKLAGQRVYFSLALAKGMAAPIRSAEIASLGLLAGLPHSPPLRSFQGYLANGGVNFTLTRGRLLAETSPPSRYASFCDTALRRFNTILGTGLEKHPNHAGVYRAMLLGQKQQMNAEQNTRFMQSGTMHLFAISGLHIAAIAGAMQAVLALLRTPRAIAFVLGLAALWLYVDITGTSPSAVRAFVMVALLLSSRIFRRPGNPLSALATSALLVLLVDPMQMFGASFQMSYGIVATLLLFGLPVAEWLATYWRPWAGLPRVSWRWHQRMIADGGRGLLEAGGLGWSAALVSVPASITFFALFTPGALAANLVLIPASGLVLVSGFISILTGLAGLTTVSALFNHAGALLLSGMDAAIKFGLRLPGAFWPAEWRAEWVGPVALAALLGACLAGYALHWRRVAGGFWTPFALVVLMLVFGVNFG